MYLVIIVCFFFFFKQKTAYEMVRSDWSSDVCSSDLLGQLMFESHRSYSACGLGSDGTDRLVELVRAAGPEHGVFGAKITGGGSGGTVAVLGRTEAESVVRELAARYATETGRAATVF